MLIFENSLAMLWSKNMEHTDFGPRGRTHDTTLHCRACYLEIVTRSLSTKNVDKCYLITTKKSLANVNNFDTNCVADSLSVRGIQYLHIINAERYSLPASSARPRSMSL
jgi:hypothetical protein